MKDKITVSAPGKLMLFGEHAVVNGRPCIVTAVDKRMKVTAELLSTPDFLLVAPDVKISKYKKSIKDLGKGDIPKGAKFVEIAVKNFLDYTKQVQDNKFGLKIVTKSEFSSLVGFGSSAASTVCIIKSLSELLGKELSQKEIFDLSYKTVLDIQGKGSGFDVAAAVYGGTLYYVSGKIIQSLEIKNFALIVGYSGIKADTVEVMNRVKEKFNNKKDDLDIMYNNIEALVKKAKQKFVEKDFRAVGQLMNENQKYLSELGVSISKLDILIKAALESGAYGAKLSGAGGGDCMIALAPENKLNAVKKAIENCGGKILNIKTNAEGVRIEL